MYSYVQSLRNKLNKYRKAVKLLKDEVKHDTRIHEDPEMFTPSYDDGYFAGMKHALKLFENLEVIEDDD